MIRQHQFEKVELVQIVQPADSYAALEAADRARRESCCRGWSCRTAWSRCARATWASAPPRPTTSRSGCRRRGSYREISSCSNYGGVPGAPHAGALAQSGDRQARAGAHAQRLGRRRRTRAGRGAGELPERGRVDHGARGAAPVHGARSAHAVGAGRAPSACRAVAWTHALAARASRMLKFDAVGTTRASFSPA